MNCDPGEPIDPARAPLLPSIRFYDEPPRAQAPARPESLPVSPAPPKYVEGLLRTGDVLLGFEGVGETLGALLTAIGRTLSVRTLVLVEADRAERGEPTTRVVGAIEPSEWARLEGHSRDVFSYFTDLSRALEWGGKPGVDVAFPLSTRGGSVVAVLVASAEDPLGEADLGFLAAVAAQLSLALAQHHRVVDALVAGSLARQLAAASVSAFARESEAGRATSRRLRRATLRAEVLAVLDAAPDPARTVGRVARLLTHRIADGCAIALGVPGALERTVVTSLASERVEEAVLRVVPRVFVMGRPVIASRRALQEDDGIEVGALLDAEAEACRVDLGVDALVCAPIRTASGETVGAIILFADDGSERVLDLRLVANVTDMLGVAFERGRVHRAAVLAAENRDRVLSTVAHDLKQPLNAMLLATTALRRRTPAEERRVFGREELDMLQRAVGRMRRLTDDLLDATSIEAHVLRLDCGRVVLEDLFEEACAQFGPGAAKRGVELVRATDAPVPPIWRDGGRVLQVLSNLMSNAIKFTPSGGTVTLGARVVGTAGSFVAVSVRDTGIGIAAADRAFIFERFWQANATAAALGTGIGLAIARTIVFSHGGKIDCESAEGLGTTFTFTLPIAA